MSAPPFRFNADPTPSPTGAYAPPLVVPIAFYMVCTYSRKIIRDEVPPWFDLRRFRLASDQPVRHSGEVWAHRGVCNPRR